MAHRAAFASEEFCLADAAIAVGIKLCKALGRFLFDCRDIDCYRAGEGWTRKGCRTRRKAEDGDCQK
jgi:hypothetical protein